MAIIRNPIITMIFSIFCALSNAQNTIPTTLDQLATQCRQVVELNDTINARQARLEELNSQLEVITQNWWLTCNEALSSPECDQNDTRISTINELIRLTDPVFESDLLGQLKNARNNAAIRKLIPKEPSKPASGRGNSASRRVTPPVTEEQPKVVQDLKKDHESTSPESKDSKKNPEKQVVPEQKENKEQKDKTKIESKDTSNRNKTINAVKDKLNKNK